MSKSKFNPNLDINPDLISCATPSIPPVYRLLGTMNKFIASETINTPNTHFANLYHPHLNNP